MTGSVQLRPVSVVMPVAENHTIVRTGQQFEALMRLCEASPIVAFDFETSGLAWWREARACGIALAVPLRAQWACAYVPFRHQGESEQLSVDVIAPALARLLARADKLWVAHNLKFDEHIARCENWVVGPRRFDTMIAAHLHDENQPIGLKDRAVIDLGHASARDAEKILDRQIALLARDLRMPITQYREQYGYAQVPVSVAGPYACFDVQYTGELYQFYEHGQVRRQFGRVLDVENALVGVIGQMEAAGVAIDVAYLEGIRESVKAQCKQIEGALQTQLGARYFNLGSDNALRDFMVRELQLPLYKQTKGGVLAVDESVLSEFAPQAPVLSDILRWREATKLATTYTGSILSQLDARNILHGEFQQVGTVTGRLSCRKPNLQNFPTDNDDRALAATGQHLKDGGKDPWSIRRAFLVEPELVRIFLDYSQIELRVLAYYSQDPLLVRAYLEGEDVHTRTSLEVFGTDAPEKRRLAKMVNFGLSYGMTEVGFSRRAHISREDATKYLQRFFERYSGVARFKDQLNDYVRSQGGFFQNIFGRPRRVQGIGDAQNWVRGRAERQVISTLIQGTAAELTKISLVRLAQWIRDEKLPVTLRQTVHDEIQMDLPREYLVHVAPRAKHIMEAFTQLQPIPVVVDGDYSITNWADKKPLPL